MSASLRISRRSFAGALALLALGHKPSFAQGFAGLGTETSGFAAVVPGRKLSFPADLGPHPEYRIEWWYVTANLTDSTGAA
jgi:predicted secreted hydrolase